MVTREIPHEQWPEFLDQFSRLHHGKPVDVQTLGMDLGAQPNARHLPLLGITAEPGAATERIEIMAGDAPPGRMSHAITHPVRLTVAEWNDGYSATLR